MTLPVYQSPETGLNRGLNREILYAVQDIK